MPPKVDLATRKAMEATVTYRATEKKKRPSTEVGQYELKRLKRGIRVDPPGEVAARVEVDVAPTVHPTVIPFGVPLVEAAGWPVRSEAERSHSPEPARDRIRSALLLGDVQRFEKLTLLELASWVYSFPDSVRITCLLCSFSFSNICFVLIIFSSW